MELEGYSLVVLDRLSWRIDQRWDRQYMSMGRVHTVLHRLRRDSAPYWVVDGPVSTDAMVIDLNMRLNRRIEGPLPKCEKVEPAENKWLFLYSAWFAGE